ncbi:uncharacterized protein LOC112269369, partial [Brachypodium distachyon]|uniref:uncharacterized protein LOC112269369 n=1 Tax=Brachypodium distachyon TaxID=15368 RepID=UPI000D0DBD2F
MIVENGVHFIGLEETMKTKYHESWFRSIAGPRSFVWQHTPPRGRSCGLLLGVNADVLETMEVELGTHLVVVYGPAQVDDKEFFLTEFAQVLELLVGKRWFQRGGEAELECRDQRNYLRDEEIKRRKKNRISVPLKDGVPVTGDEDLLRHLTEFYKELFSPLEISSIKLDGIIKGFGDKWCDWVMRTVRGGRVAIKVNDQIGPYFPTYKGVRQGDPLSPLLFNIIAEGLTMLINKAKRSRVDCWYADYTILLLQDDLEQARDLKFILYIFEKVYGLKINFHKSELYYLGDAALRSSAYSEIFTCSVGDFPFTYLGIHIDVKRPSNAQWKPVEEKVEKRLAGWKGNFLSMGGRTVLINSCMSSVPLYMLSFLEAKEVIKRIDHSRKRMLWQEHQGKKKYHLKDKLKSNGSNFTDWFRNVRIILEAAKKAYVFDAALGAEPALQKRFEHHSAYAMIGELNTLFQTQARAERYDASERFFNCKMEENSSVSEHVLRMSGYADRLRQLGIEIPNELGIDRVLQSLPPSYKSFVVNYNMQGMDRTLPQLLAMLKTAEVEIKKEHQVLMVNKTTSFKKAKGKKGNFKKGGKTVATPAKKPKSGPKPDTECFYCKGTGHWKHNCPKYLADKKAGNVKGEYLSYEFGTHLRQCGIVSQLTPPGTPQRNGVSERRNRTLLDMVRSMMCLTDLPLSFWGYALETAAFTLNRAPSKSVETTPYELWFGKKPKLSFLKVWGCEAYVKRLQPDKLEPKSEKCVFIGYPKETIGYTFYHRSEGKVFVAKNGSFLEKEFLSKEVSGRKVELDEVIEPSLEFECSAAPETVPVHPASAREEANDNDHEVLNETTTELRRSTRTRNTPEWYNVRVMNVMLLDNDEPANYEEAMMSPDSEKWLEAMKSEMGSMYENQVWTLVDLPNDRKAVENKWIFKKKTDADGNVTVYKARLVIKGFGFVQTHGEACIYKKVSGSSVAFLILYVNDILLIGNDIELLKSVKGYLNKSFSMKDLGEAAYILGIKIYRDDSKSQSGYVFI